jgi:predicted RNA-binding protein with PIN domain
VKKRRATRQAAAAPAPSGARTVVVDGYNLILRSPVFRPDDRRDLAAARDKLVNLLSWAVGQGEAEFIVIFDGAETGVGAARTERSGRVTVRFSTPPEKADDLIRTVVEELEDRDHAITVVTSDLEVASHARTHGATVVLSDLFAASLFPERVREQVGEFRRAAAAETEGTDKPLGSSKKDMAEWMRLFGEQRREEEQ